MEQETEFVYMLLCADGTLYTGWTNRLAARVAAHNAGRGAKYTKPRRPVRLVYCERLPDKPAALRRECALKALTRTEKLALVACGGNLDGLEPAMCESAVPEISGNRKHSAHPPARVQAAAPETTPEGRQPPCSTSPQKPLLRAQKAANGSD